MLASCTFFVSLLTIMLRLDSIELSLFSAPSAIPSLFHLLTMTDYITLHDLQSMSPVPCTSACSSLSLAPPGQLSFECPPFQVSCYGCSVGFWLPEIVLGIPTPLAFLGDSDSSSQRAPHGYEYTYLHCQTNRIDGRNDRGTGGQGTTKGQVNTGGGILRV